MSYPTLLPWLERARDRCEAERVRSFLDEFGIYIRKQFMGIRDMTEREQIVEVARQSPENLRSAMQLIAAAAEIKAAVLASLGGQVHDALPEGYELAWFDASQDRYTGLGIRMPGVADLHFSVSFEAYDYNWLIYGVSRPKGTVPISDPKAALDAEYGRGTVTEQWPWYRRATPSERIFPVAGDWRTMDTPWLDVADGAFAGTVARAAQTFRESIVRAG